MAKSASEEPNSSRKALPIAGIASGSVTVRNTRQREAPRLKEASSSELLIEASIGRSAR